MFQGAAVILYVFSCYLLRASERTRFEIRHAFEILDDLFLYKQFRLRVWWPELGHRYWAKMSRRYRGIPLC